MNQDHLLLEKKTFDLESLRSLLQRSPEIIRENPWIKNHKNHKDQIDHLIL